MKAQISGNATMGNTLYFAWRDRIPL